MTLPRKGDRVRVTEASYQRALAGRELLLTHDAYWYDDSQTWLRFRCDEAGYVGPVKVEILELANRQDLHRGLQSVIDRADRGDTRAVSPGANQYDAGFVAGLRRAQELAKEHVYLQCDGGKCGECAPDSCVMFDDFNQAIDAEAAKERT